MTKKKIKVIILRDIKLDTSIFSKHWYRDGYYGSYPDSIHCDPYILSTNTAASTVPIDPAFHQSLLFNILNRNPSFHQ